MSLTKQEKDVLKSIVKVHLKEVKADSSAVPTEWVALLGAEARYEKVLKDILKKL